MAPIEAPVAATLDDASLVEESMTAAAVFGASDYRGRDTDRNRNELRHFHGNSDFLGFLDLTMMVVIWYTCGDDALVQRYEGRECGGRLLMLKSIETGVVRDRLDVC
uniref:Uncharacterized protein n=1 Tax=Peronospora matthiolae TaxID=2874970 RepID=A0AAV1U002_9STRA